MGHFTPSSPALRQLDADSSHLAICHLHTDVVNEVVHAGISNDSLTSMYGGYLSLIYHWNFGKISKLWVYIGAFVVLATKLVDQETHQETHSYDIDIFVASLDPVSIFMQINMFKANHI